MFLILAIVSWLGFGASMPLAAEPSGFPALSFLFFAGFGAAALGIMLFLKCPRCQGPLGATNATIKMDNFLFTRKMNYCPYCGVSLDERFEM
jgi:hypothetical protein